MTTDPDLKDWLRHVEEDRAECTPLNGPNGKDSLSKSTPRGLLPTEVLVQNEWPQAAAFVWGRLSKIEGLERDDLAADFWSAAKPRCKTACTKLADRLFKLGQGEAALCCQMLAVDGGVWSKTMIRAAADLGISEFALRQLCKRYMIPMPPRGHFNHKDPKTRPLKSPLRSG